VTPAVGSGRARVRTGPGPATRKQDEKIAERVVAKAATALLYVPHRRANVAGAHLDTRARTMPM